MNIDQKSVDELRVLSNEMITNAKSGHPGIALGGAPIIYSLYANVLAVNPADPKNMFRDRFVLSAGHGSSILYSTLYAMGYNLSTKDLKEFRSINSKTPGHPEVDMTDGVDASTGPLGQGISNAVGLAIAEKWFEANFNKPDLKLFDSTIFCMSGDGCLMEGISYEALSIAGNLKLDNFVLIYDYNQITIEGKTEITFTEDIEQRFKAIGFEVLYVKDGNNPTEITEVLCQAKACKKPTIVIVPTVIGYGTELAGNQKIHGSPLTAEMLESLKTKLNVSKPDFDLSADVKQNFAQKQADAKKRFDLQNKLKEYKEKYPEDYKRLQTFCDEKQFEKYAEQIKQIKVDNSATTRDINFEVMQSVDKIVPNLIGGSADVATSTKAYVKTEKSFSKYCYASKYFHYGIREHAMAGISNGMALFGGLLPYESCFLTFMDYLKPSLRMSALMNLRTLSVFSHDSITAGQDGPTHQPVEQLPTLRMIPNTIVSRPYNLAEILATYVWLVSYHKPVCMLVSKDKMEFEESSVADALRGGYVLKDAKNAHITLVSTGGDVDRCLKAAEVLKEKNIVCRVVSMPCISIFESQPDEYKKNVLESLPKVFVEASSEYYWYKLASSDDLVINITDFGKSGSPEQVEKYMKIDANTLANRICDWLKNE